MECLDKKAKLRFIEINNAMADALRSDIMQDSGHTKLKNKCLDVIQKLRVEANILNPSKNQKATG